MFKLSDNFTESALKDALKDSTQESEGSTLDDTAAKLKNIQDTVEPISSIASKATGKIESKRNTTRSIVARARGSILQFPVYMSKSVPVAEAHTINKAFERVYASFVQGALSAENSVIEDPTEINNMKFLQKFHTNIKDSDYGGNLKSVLMDLFNEYYQPIDTLDEIFTESIHNEVNLGNGIKVVFEAGPATDHNVIKECKRLSNEPLTGFRFLTEAAVPASSKRETSTTQTTEIKTTKEATTADINKAAGSVSLKEYMEKNPDATETDKIKYQQDEVKKQMKAGKVISLDKDHDITYKNGKFVVIVTSSKTVSSKSAAKMPADPPTLLRETDVKKANGMQPYSIVATFFVLQKGEGGKDGWLREVKLVINVKTIMHLISVNDLGEDLQSIVTGKQRALQKIRYKTGEISFWKDYVLNLKNIKADALNSVSSKRWLNTLKRLGEFDKFKGTLINSAAKGLVQGNGTPIPNATLVLTQSNISYLKDVTGIDLEQIKNAKLVCDSLFLMAFVIVDSTAGSMKVFFPDMDNDWDVQSLASIDAEVSKMDNSRLLSELNRSRIN